MAAKTEEPASTAGRIRVDLSRYRVPQWHDRGRIFLVRAIWHCVNAIFLQNPLNVSSGFKVLLLRLFGARIGRGVVLKPGINVKSPWLLEIGDNSWVGERVWLDTVFPISLGSNVCISQGAYLCTGNHDWSDPHFGLMQSSLRVEDGAWIGAGAIILPGAWVASHAVITAGALLSQRTQPYTIYAGNPAVAVRERVIRDSSDRRPTAEELP